MLDHGQVKIKSPPLKLHDGCLHEEPTVFLVLEGIHCGQHPGTPMALFTPPMLDGIPMILLNPCQVIHQIQLHNNVSAR